LPGSVLIEKDLEVQEKFYPGRFYPRLLTQSDEPDAGTGEDECDAGELVIWKDSDDNKNYLCFNDSGTVKKVELS